MDFEVKDYAVSGEEFKLIYDGDLDMYCTDPQPTADQLPLYYQSEDYISHTDSKRNAFEKIYHFIRSLALRKKLKLINSLNSNGKCLLDLGCGTGDFLKIAKDNGWQVQGIEQNQNARKIANKKTGNLVWDESKLWELESDKFDVITLWHVLEHLPDLEKHIQRFKNLLKEEGYLIIAVPNFKSYDARYYKKHWAAYDVPRHLWHFSKTAIQRSFEPLGFNLIKTLPMKFDSYYVSLLSEKYKNGANNPFRAFYIGLLSNLKAKRSKECSSHIYVLNLAKKLK